MAGYAGEAQSQGCTLPSIRRIFAEPEHTALTRNADFRRKPSVNTAPHGQIGQDTVEAPPGLSRNLLIMHSPQAQHISDWQTVKALINERAPDIEVRIATNGQPNSVTRRWQVTRPSLVFSPIWLVDYVPRGGTIYAGRPMSKFEELGRLIKAGLPVPRTVELSPSLVLSPAIWGDYVVVKPDRSSRGKGVRLVATKTLSSLYRELSADGSARIIVQAYVDHLDHEGRQQEFRVLTMFGRPLYAMLRRSTRPRPPLAALAADPQAKITINPQDGQESEMVADPDLLAFATRVASALPELPVLGLDILRENTTGSFHILETNPSGHVWHLSSRLTIERIEPKVRAARYSQFNALSLAADLLIERTRSEAS
jgi:hypothetical protein